MKITIYDYIIISTLITLIAGLALICAYYTYYMPSIPAGFRAILSVFNFLISYGIVTALALGLIRKTIKFKPGEYAMQSIQFGLWKLHSVLTQLAMPCIKIITPIFLRPLFYIVFGATIGKQVAIGGKILDPYFTTMEDYAVIGQDAIVSSHIMTGDRFYLGRVTLGRNCTVGVQSFIMPGVTIGQGAVILPGSLVKRNTSVPDFEVWGGNPAKKIKNAP